MTAFCEVMQNGEQKECFLDPNIFDELALQKQLTNFMVTVNQVLQFSL